MNLPKRPAARIAAALGLAAIVAVSMGWVPAAGASSRRSEAVPAGPVGTTGPRVQSGVPAGIHRGPDPRMPAPSVGAAPAAPAPVPATAAGGGAAPVSNGSAARAQTTYTQTFNWSGEFQRGSVITAVSGSWTVPAVPASNHLAMVSTWVGIGGLSTTAPLIQAGTISVQTTTGTTAYSAWYEMLPNQSYTVTSTATVGGTASFTVKPGDVMSVSLTNVGGNNWDIVISDETAGWRFEHTFTYASTETSAEWVTERPAYVNGSQYSLYTLADYGTTRFTNLEVAQSSGALGAPTALGAFAMYDTTGSVISASGPVSSATGTSFTDHYIEVPARIDGTTADATAAAELTAAFPSASGQCPGPSTTTRAIVLATNATYPDALSSAYLASTLSTGTLLTAPTSLTATTLNTIRDEGITHVYVLGGTLAISQAVVGELQGTNAYACGGASALAGTQKLQVSRIGGATEYDTAEMVAETPASSDVGALNLSGAYGGMSASGGQGVYNMSAGNASTAPPSTAAIPTAVLATGATFQDAESASTLAYADRLPIVLSTPTSLSSQALSTLRQLGIAQVVVMGGPLAISDAVVSALEADGFSALRVAGADATQTAAELARCELGAASTAVGLGWPATGGVAVARGDFYTDGLAGAVVAADGPARTSPEPLLLTEGPGTVGPYLTSFLNQAGTTGIDGKVVTHLTIFGGVEAVTQGVANTLSLDLLG